MDPVSTARGETVQPDLELVVIDTNRAEGFFDLRELWRYRDLIWIFALRDITVRYRQTLVGVGWTILQPLALMIAFGLFKRMISTETKPGPIPEPVLTLSGLLLYQLFAGIISASVQCLVDNRQMLTKVYFPRAVLPLAAALRPMLDFVVGMILLVLLLIWFHVVPPVTALLAPIIVVCTGLVGLSFGMWLSALNAHYRDFGHIVPFALQIGLLVSPVASNPNSLSGFWRWLYFLNPIAALIECFRWSLLGADTFPGGVEICISALSATFFLCTGAWYFRRVDRFLADNI